MGHSDKLLNSNKTLTLKGITSKHKDALIGGGLSFTALGLGIGLFKMLGSKEEAPVLQEESPIEPIIENEVVEVEPIDKEILSEEASTYGSVESEALDFELSAEEEIISYTFYSDVQIAFNVHDNMSFDEAFASARNETGPGGFFNYKGDTYSTFYKEEWEGMSPSNKEDYLTQVQNQSHFDHPYVETEAVIDDFEIINEDTIEEVESVSQDNDFDENEIGEAPTAEADSREEISTSNNEEASSDIIDLIEEDDFFSDLDENTPNDVIVVRPVYGLDSNDDGVVDMIAFDDNEDGIADLVALDEDYDGNYESFMINEDGGENLDVFIVDQGLDGIDTNDSREDIDDIISMDDFILVEDDSIENLDRIEQLLDNEENNSNQAEVNFDETEDSFEDSFDDDFDEIGL